MIYQADAKEIADLDICKEALEILHAHYPGYPWQARCDGGVLFVKNLLLWGFSRKRDGSLGVNSSIGFAMKTDSIRDAGVRKKKVVRAGGELLERAKLARRRMESGQGFAIMEGAV